MSDYKITFNDEFKNALRATGSTLAFSVYQAGKIVLLNVDDEDKLVIAPVSYQKPMGLAFKDDLLAITTLNELHVYANSKELAEKLVLKRPVNDLYIPRQTFYTGPLDLHDVCFVGDQVWAVNTLFSCIASFDHLHSFTPQWRPYFISELAPEDRCHLNGLALENGKPCYITALGSGNSNREWKENITHGGILMSIDENKILLDGLAMPHSPKIIGDYIYLLESAKGELVKIDRKTFEKQTVVKLPGMVRGLSIANNTAFIGISKVREKSTTFNKLDDSVKAENAAIYAVDLGSGMILGRMRFSSRIEEIYDIQLVTNMNKVGIFGLYDDRYKLAITTPEGAFWRKPKESSKTE